MNLRSNIYALLLILSLIALAAPAFAKDKNKDKDKKKEKIIERPAGYYAPEYCDFEMTFPEEAYKTKKCPAGDNKCYDLTSYTMVYVI